MTIQYNGKESVHGNAFQSSLLKYFFLYFCCYICVLKYLTRDKVCGRQTCLQGKWVLIFMQKNTVWSSRISQKILHRKRSIVISVAMYEAQLTQNSQQICMTKIRCCLILKVVGKKVHWLLSTDLWSTVTFKPSSFLMVSALKSIDQL